MSSGVEFESDSSGYSRPKQGIPSNYGVPGMSQGYGVPGADSGQSGMTGFLMRHGLAKSPGAAQAILVGVSILNFIITLFVVFFLIF